MEPLPSIGLETLCTSSSMHSATSQPMLDVQRFSTCLISPLSSIRTMRRSKTLSLVVLSRSSSFAARSETVVTISCGLESQAAAGLDLSERHRSLALFVGTVSLPVPCRHRVQVGARFCLRVWGVTAARRYAPAAARVGAHGPWQAFYFRIERAVRFDGSQACTQRIDLVDGAARCVAGLGSRSDGDKPCR